jgi:divalent metal cation (Fe/Co/Zn/Cd) transporter
MADAASRALALRRGIQYEALTVGWMFAEAILAIGAGIAARSVLLTAFGADSVIELLSGATLLWRLRVEETGGVDARIDVVERRATWVSAVLLILLCAYVVLSAVAGLLLRIQPGRSWLGIAVAAAAVLAMPWLAARKRAANETIQSPALRADIAESVTCAYLAAVTLAGVLINALTGWWWFEYIGALALLIWLVHEAREALNAARDASLSGHRGR